MTATPTVPTYPFTGCEVSIIRKLVAVAVRGLPAMFDEHRRLFCFRLKKTRNGLVREGLSPRYTAITLLGLHRLEQSGAQSPVEITPSLNVLLANAEWVTSGGDLGLLLWLCAQVAPERLRDLRSRLSVRDALQRHPDLRRGHTMELAWLLTGLSYWAQRCPTSFAGLERLAGDVYKKLTDNQGEDGLFGHNARTDQLHGHLRAWVGSFADQVYPIYAMATSHFGDQADGIIRASRCARTICHLQGEKGQWWWHYDSSTGRTVNGYPVFSVHQHAMAPMALFKLGDVTDNTFQSHIARGLNWIKGQNELGYRMDSCVEHVIWRCIERRPLPLLAYLNAAFGREDDHTIEAARGLRVRFECRPYELGWLLYAFSDCLHDFISTPGSNGVESAATFHAGR